MCQIYVVDVFEPNRLVYAGRLHVPTAEILIFPTLFAAHLHGAIGVRATNRKHVFLLGQIGRDVERKTLVRAAVFAYEYAVHIDPCFVVCALEMQ